MPTHAAQGNGSGRFNVHQEDLGGWVRVFADPREAAPPNLAAWLSHALTEWFRQRPHLRMRCVVPVDRGGETVELHAAFCATSSGRFAQVETAVVSFGLAAHYITRRRCRGPGPRPRIPCTRPGPAACVGQPAPPGTVRSAIGSWRAFRPGVRRRGAGHLTGFGGTICTRGFSTAEHLIVSTRRVGQAALDTACRWG